MTQTIRANLLAAARSPGASPSNPGLELDCFLREIGDKNAAANLLNERIENAPAPEIYRASYARWERTLAALDDPTGRLAKQKLTVVGRLIVGLGAESVREASVAVQRVYGMPVIPGSALKGLARHYAETAIANHDPSNPLAAPDSSLSREEKEQSENAHFRLFGDMTSASHFEFYDAWFVPDANPNTRGPFRRDVITVHHPNYYGSRGGNPNGPWDFDDPNPNPFLSVTGAFLVAVRGPDAEWAQLALALLKQALANWGAGAKTSSGYGRLRRIAAPRVEPSDSVARAIRRSDSEIRKALDGVGGSWRKLTDNVQKSVDAATVIARVEREPKLEKWATPMSWFKEMKDHLANHPAPEQEP